MDLLNSDNARMNQDIIRKAGEIVEKTQEWVHTVYWLK
mgnify:CR=1 FL=1